MVLGKAHRANVLPNGIARFWTVLSDIVHGEDRNFVPSRLRG
jgi:hypothetical protein